MRGVRLGVEVIQLSFLGGWCLSLPPTFHSDIIQQNVSYLSSFAMGLLSVNPVVVVILACGWAYVGKVEIGFVWRYSMDSPA